jgi:hypothetical protein
LAQRLALDPHGSAPDRDWQQGAQRMPVLLVDEIVSSFERERSRSAAAMAKSADLRIRDECFQQSWNRVYPRSRELTPLVQEKIIRRLLRLARFLRVRFWDYAISERLTEEQDFYTEIAVRLLAHACVRNESQLRYCLNRSKVLFPTVAKRHRDLFGEIELAMSTGLRPTPALSQAEMARAIGVSYDTFRGDVRAGRWRAVAKDAVKNKRRRRWRHVAVEEHARSLKQIRRRLRRRLWADLPTELQETTGVR